MRVVERLSGEAAPGGAARTVTPGQALRAGVRGVARAWHGVWWYLREITGENGYRHYLDAYEARHGCTHGAMTEREFWRDKTDRQDREPQARCC